MPSGLGKTVKVAVLCSEDEFKKIEEQGVKVDVWVND
jgi:hypothetical protein